MVHYITDPGFGLGTYDEFALRDVIHDVPVDDANEIGDIASIAVTPANPSIAHPNTQQFVATATMEDGSTRVVTTQVVWASATVADATIDQAGLATSVSSGSSVISATLAGKTGSTTLTVT